MAKKWILYSGQLHGNEEITRHNSIKECEERVRYNIQSTGSEWFGRMYPYSEDNWSDAMDFKDVGCPFDYPSMIIVQGKRGGIKAHYA